MSTDALSNPKMHHGRNIKRLRDILGVKQETIAIELDMTQQAVSKLESRAEIDDEMIDKVAKILNIPTEAIKNFDEQATVNFITNTFNDEAIQKVENFANTNCTFNPLDKVVELYERMLKAEQEKVALLEKRVNEKK